MKILQNFVLYLLKNFKNLVILLWHKTANVIDLIFNVSTMKNYQGLNPEKMF